MVSIGMTPNLAEALYVQFAASFAAQGFTVKCFVVKSDPCLFVKTLCIEMFTGCPWC